MAHLSPFSLLNVDFNRLLVCFAPQVFVCDDLRPPDVADVAQAFVQKCLELVSVCLGCAPGF